MTTSRDAQAPIDAKSLGNAKFRVLSAVGRDRSLSILAKSAANVVVCDYMRPTKGGVAFMHRETLAAELGLAPSSASNLSKALAELVNGGYLTAQRHIGRATHYEIARRFFEEAESDAPCGQNDHMEELSCGQNDLTACGQNDLTYTVEYKTVEYESVSLATLAPGREGQIIPPDRSGERSYPTIGRRRGQLPIPLEGGNGKADPEGFAEFWLVSPKKVGRDAAANAFREVRMRATAEEILAGAQRYAAVKAADRRDPTVVETYTKDAVTWLRGRHWEDEHAKPRPYGIGRHTAEALEEAGALYE